MSKSIPNAAFDAYFAYFSACTRQDLVSDAETPANLNNTLAHVAMAGGDFSIDDGDVDGRKLIVAAKDGVDVTNEGTTKHAVLSLDSAIRLVTTCAERAVDDVAGDKVNMGSYELTVRAVT